MKEIIKCEFYGTELIGLKEDSKKHVAMKPLVEGMGLTWSRQRKKLLQDREKYGVTQRAIPSKGGMQETICIEFENLPLWLASVDAWRVKNPVTKSNIIRYQKECAIALYQHFVEPQQQHTNSSFWSEYKKLADENAELRAESKVLRIENQALREFFPTSHPGEISDANGCERWRKRRGSFTAQGGDKHNPSRLSHAVIQLAFQDCFPTFRLSLTEGNNHV